MASDTLAVAGLFRCLVRRLLREPGLNADRTAAFRARLENVWRAFATRRRLSIHEDAACRKRIAEVVVGGPAVAYVWRVTSLILSPAGARKPGHKH